MIRAAMLAVLLQAGPAAAECLIFCTQDGDIPAAQVQDLIERELGARLPQGVTALGLYEGGFQDRFIQAKFRADAAGLVALLALLQADPARFAAPGVQQMQIAEAAWWDPMAQPGLVAGPGVLAAFAYTTVAIAPDPKAAGMVLVYLISFQT